jgi:hypothetical protein
MKITKPTYRRRTIAILANETQAIVGARQDYIGGFEPSGTSSRRHSFSGGLYESEADESHHQQQQHHHPVSSPSLGTVTEIELVDRIKKKDL